MDTIIEGSSHEDQVAKPGHPIQVGGPDLQFRRIVLDDATPTGRQIVSAAGHRPAEDYAVLQWLRSGDLEPLRLNEAVDLREPGVERFIIAKTERAYFFVLEGERQEWLVPFINGITLKRLADKDPDEFSVFLERQDQPDQEIDNDDMVDLSAEGLEKFRLRPIDRVVTIFVNGKKNPVKITRGLHTGLEIKQAAIDQGVKIKIDYILSLEKPNGETEIIGDHDKVPVKAGQHYVAVADDDVS